MNSDLYHFLVEAKKQTYANEKVKKILSSRKGSFDYEYSNDKMIYHDTYFGGTKFMGEEVVYSSNDTPIWGMNYYGITLNENLSEEASLDRLDRQIVNTFINSYDDIMQSVQTESAEVMKMYQMLNSQYALVSKRFKM